MESTASAIRRYFCCNASHWVSPSETKDIAAFMKKKSLHHIFLNVNASYRELEVDYSRVGGLRLLQLFLLIGVVIFFKLDAFYASNISINDFVLSALVEP